MKFSWHTNVATETFLEPFSSDAGRGTEPGGTERECVGGWNKGCMTCIKVHRPSRVGFHVVHVILKINPRQAVGHRKRIPAYMGTLPRDLVSVRVRQSNRKSKPIPSKPPSPPPPSRAGRPRNRSSTVPVSRMVSFHLCDS